MSSSRFGPCSLDVATSGASWPTRRGGGGRSRSRDRAAKSKSVAQRPRYTAIPRRAMSTNVPSSRIASYRSNFASARSYVRHLIHFGFGGNSHSSGSNPLIAHSRDLIFALTRWHGRSASRTARRKRPGGGERLGSRRALLPRSHHRSIRPRRSVPSSSASSPGEKGSPSIP